LHGIGSARIRATEAIRVVNDCLRVWQTLGKRAKRYVEIGNLKSADLIH
jgi:hypothetical protein